MSSANAPSGSSPSTGTDPILHQIAFLMSLVAIGLGWQVVAHFIPVESRFNWRDLILEHWHHRTALEPWLDQRWSWLALHRYPYWFAIAALPGVLAIGAVQAIDRRAPWPLLSTPLGWGGGIAVGLWLSASMLADSPTVAVMLPAMFAYLGGAVSARLGASPRGVTHLRGTKMRESTSRLRNWMIVTTTNRLTLAGVPLTMEDETMHVAAIGATGSGKSTALRALMAGAARRGDRQVVADPDGSALGVFYQPGDVILNPYDARCAHWDLLSEIEHESDFAMLSGSLLPHLGHGDHDQWISYAQQFLASAMENWVANAMGNSSDFVVALNQANRAQLKALCDGTPAARYFEEGGERMLASILGTITPAVASLRSFSAPSGPGYEVAPFVRTASRGF